MACRVANLREYLVGSWTLQRTVADRRRCVRGTLQGRAVFTPDERDLFLVETGRLRFGAFAGSAQCDYRYVFRTDARADIRFPDGRHFCSVSLSSGSCSVEHRCGSDHYHGTFIAMAPDCLRIEWNARGPAKDLVIKSWYRRA